VDKVGDQDTVVAAKTIAINHIRHTEAIASSPATEIYVAEPFCYMSPELISQKVDVYDFGDVLYQLIYAKEVVIKMDKLSTEFK
ncbi:hypothetical protein RYX36_006753, partial [Vicia faba]